MRNLQDILRPKRSDKPWLLDVAGVGLLTALAAIFKNAWSVDAERFIVDVTGQMASPYMLIALGMLLALRCGVIDLSVWAVAGMGGLVAAGLINAGIDPIWAMAAACGAGCAAGCLNALMTAGLRRPGPAATLATGIVIFLACRWCVPTGMISVPDNAFANWHVNASDAGSDAVQNGEPAEPEWMPLLVTRTLLAAGAYSAVMLVLLTGDASGRMSRERMQLAPARPRRLLAAAMCASGALSALAGASWLLDGAAVAGRPIGDLRVVAGMMLAGTMLFAGAGRTLLAGLCLPPAMLVATAWRQDAWAWDMQFLGYDGQCLQLAIMVLAAHLAARCAVRGQGLRRWLALASASATAAGVLLTAGVAITTGPEARKTFYVAGLAVWVAGAAALLAAWRVGAGKKTNPAAAVAETKPPDEAGGSQIV